MSSNHSYHILLTRKGHRFTLYLREDCDWVQLIVGRVPPYSVSFTEVLSDLSEIMLKLFGLNLCLKMYLKEITTSYYRLFVFSSKSYVETLSFDVTVRGAGPLRND